MIPRETGWRVTSPKSTPVKETLALKNAKIGRVNVLEGGGEELFEEIKTHQIDLLVSNYPAPVSSGLYSRSLAKIPIGLYRSGSFRALKKKFPASLKDQPVILPTVHSQLRQDIDHYFSAHGLSHQTVAEIQDTSVQKLLAIDGACLVALPEFSAQSYVREKKLVLVGVLKGVFEEFWLISAKRNITNPISNWIVKDFKFNFLAHHKISREEKRREEKRREEKRSPRPGFVCRSNFFFEVISGDQWR